MLAIYSIQILSLYFGPLESAHNVRFDVKSAYVEIKITTYCCKFIRWLKSQSGIRKSKRSSGQSCSYADQELLLSETAEICGGIGNAEHLAVFRACSSMLLGAALRSANPRECSVARRGEFNECTTTTTRAHHHHSQQYNAQIHNFKNTQIHKDL